MPDYGTEELNNDDWDRYRKDRTKRTSIGKGGPVSATSFLTAVPNAVVQAGRWLVGTTVDKVSSDAKWVAAEVSQLRSQGWSH